MFETLGQYKILDRIGAGGMGEVYRARDTRLGRTVAIKVLAPQLQDDPERRARFLREARAAAALSHPNIAALYEIGEDQGQLFLVFEFVPGDTLQTVIGGRPLNPRRAIDFAAQIADALADAHAAGIVHRDIKPAHIIITPKDKAKVLDFGLAAWTGGGAERAQAVQDSTVMVTAAGTTLGTIAYMSPEQTLGERVDDRTDIFSLGIVLFEMLTGRLPFSGATPAALSLQIVQATAPAASDVNRSVPKELDAIVARALTKPLVHRYQSAAMLSAELRAVGDILDVRSDRAVPAAAKSIPRPVKIPVAWWIAAAVVLLAAIAIWLGRGSLARMWRLTIGSTPAPVIAVIPFETGAGQTFFADGLADDLITRLGQTPGLKVIGRSATRSYRGRTPQDVARETRAAVILTGSVQPAADTIKVSLELVDPSDNTALWSRQYMRDVKDVFAVQAQVAEEVAAALRVKLTPTPSSARAASRTVDPRAYETYLRASAALDSRDLSTAQRLYRDAIAADAGLAEAFAGLAEALHLQTGFAGELDAAAAAERRAAAERAYQLDPDLPRANVAMGLASPSLAEALRYLRHAVEADPSNGDAYHQIADQISEFDPDRALALYRKSLELDPKLEMGHIDIAGLLLGRGRSDQARRELSAVQLAPLRRAAEIQTVYVDLDERRVDDALARLNKNPGLRDSALEWILYIRALRTSGRSDDALGEASRALSRFPDVCEVVALAAGLRLEHGAAGAARALAASQLRAADQPNASPATARCGVFTSAALNDPPAVARRVDAIGANEAWLRYWKRYVNGSTGPIELRGRIYPLSQVVGDPRVTAAKQRLDAAFAREGEIARSALAGLP
jgi:TolB-like protein/tRNA A-37 threonylcarbamoyl transferase component Bud32